MDDFENWISRIQLVHTKEVAQQITKNALRTRAEKAMIFTRKAGAGVRRARAVCCGNYSESRFSADCYAGGADGCQVRALVRAEDGRTESLWPWRSAPSRKDLTSLEKEMFGWCAWPCAA